MIGARKDRPDDRFAVRSNGTTSCNIIASISLGTPGNATISAFFHVRQNPGAEPAGFFSTVAPDGIMAWRNCAVLAVRPHCASRVVIASNASLRRLRRCPVAEGTASLVQSSTVGPSQQVLMLA